MGYGGFNEELENQNLKKEFSDRGLDLSQVFIPNPGDLEEENHSLKLLLFWIEKYSELGSRRKMEAAGYEFPPVQPGLTPENDWYRFENWINGIQTKVNFREILESLNFPEDPDKLTEDEINSKMEKLEEIINAYRVSIGFNRGLPPRIKFLLLLECLEDDLELLVHGGWTLDGCSGYCPGCLQRPWCESSSEICWNEDSEAGEMYLVEKVKRYVSASPVSLKILEENQAELDKRMEEFMKNRDDDQPPDSNNSDPAS